MARNNALRRVPAMMLVVVSGAASASGFQLMEQNASGIGNAYAGSAAIADNASTLYFNPAGMTQLKARELSMGIAAVDPGFRFNDQGSQVGTPGSGFASGGLMGAGEGGNAGGWSFIPNGYASWALGRDVYAGVGISAPFGLKTEYSDTWVGAAQAQMFEVRTININPSLAWRVNETVSLGAGVNWQRVEATYKRWNSTSAVGVTTPVKLTLDDDSWGWNAGALFTVSPTTRVGLAYRSAIKHETKGRTDVNGAKNNDSKASLKLPDTAILSVTQQLSDTWQMLGDVSWTGWSSIPKVDIMNATSGSATPSQTLDTDFRDTWRIALGANNKYNDAWTLKYGIAYDQTPVKRAATRMVSLPDNDRVWFSFGAQWMPDKANRLDLGVAYIYVKDSRINNDQTAAARGRVVGEYTASIWVLGAQYSMAF